MDITQNANKSFRNFYLMNAIYGLAGSFIGIFIPIYILRKTLDPANVFHFYLVYSLTILVFFFLAYYLVRIIGLRWSVIISYPILFLYFFLVYNIDRFGLPIPLVAIVSGIQVSLYWFPLHMWLSNTSDESSLGGDLSKFFAFSKIIGFFAPVIGAIVATTLGFKSLFLLSAGVYLVSAIPLFYLPEFPFKEELKVAQFVKLFKAYPHYVIAEVLENVREDAEGIIWPVFIYLSFKNILSIGYLGTLESIGSILFIYLVGRYTDKTDKRRLLGAGALIMVVLWTLMYFVHAPLYAYALTLIMSFFDSLVIIPINAIVYGVAKREGPVNFILFREFFVTLGRVLLYAFALLATVSIKYTFIFTAVACLGIFVLSRTNLEARSVT